eukprot:369655-Karenia_brevis.AAC.1
MCIRDRDTTVSVGSTTRQVQSPDSSWINMHMMLTKQTSEEQATPPKRAVDEQATPPARAVDATLHHPKGL